MKQSRLNSLYSIATVLAAGMCYVEGEITGNESGGNTPVPIPVPVPVVEVPKTKEQLAAEKEAADKARAEMIDAIKAAFNNKVDVVPTKFFFKKVKEVDDKGKETGIETKRPTIELPIIRPSFEGILEFLKLPDSKEAKLIMEAVGEVATSRARELINENENLTAENFDLRQLDWSVIANLPPAERRGGGIAKETWEEFVKDYVAVMPGVTGKPADTVQKSAKLFAEKFATVKTVKKILSKLKELLGIYANATTRGEEFEDCIEFLGKKLDMLLAADEQQLADAL